jgi:hypothetical protein
MHGKPKSHRLTRRALTPSERSHRQRRHVHVIIQPLYVRTAENSYHGSTSIEQLLMSNSAVSTLCRSLAWECEGAKLKAGPLATWWKGVGLSPAAANKRNGTERFRTMSFSDMHKRTFLGSNLGANGEVEKRSRVAKSNINDDQAREVLYEALRARALVLLSF